MKPTSTNEFSNDRLSADQLGERARALYRNAGPAIGTSTAARLRATRRAALDAADKPPHTLRWMMPAGAFAVAALAVVVVWQPLRQGSSPATAVHSGAATQMIDSETELPPDADSADPALYQNLDFYAWLAQQPSTHRPKGG